MLTQIYVKNFVLIDAVRLDLDSRMSVFTGETGAGKSLLIDAIGLLCGQRASAGYVKRGAQRAIIEGVFSLRPNSRAAALLALCTGCSARFAAVDELMRPPRLSGENSGIEEAFENAVQNKNVQIKTPMAGQYRSAYVLYDLDADGREEAIAFYSDARDDTTAYMHILDFDGEVWRSAADIKGEGSDVYEIAFCDMNADGLSEATLTLDDSSASRTIRGLSDKRVEASTVSGKVEILHDGMPSDLDDTPR